MVLFIACDGGLIYNIFRFTVSIQWAKLHDDDYDDDDDDDDDDDELFLWYG